jgi:hypothetical protein
MSPLFAHLLSKKVPADPVVKGIKLLRKAHRIAALVNDAVRRQHLGYGLPAGLVPDFLKPSLTQVPIRLSRSASVTYFIQIGDDQAIWSSTWITRT